MKKRIIIGTVVAAIIAGVLLAASAVSASTRARGPFFLKALNANVCVAVSPDRPGTQVIQGDYAEGHCRKLFFDQSGHINGFPYGKWETTGGNALATTDCTTVTLQPADSGGTNWVTFIMGGGVPQKIISKSCDERLGSSNCVEALAATGDVSAPWFVINWRENPGYFTNMHIIAVSRAGRKFLRAQQVRSFHEQPAVRAGC